MNEEARDFITAMGAMAEGCGLFLKELLKQGFSRKEALTLVTAFVTATIQPKQIKEDN
jgi:hypothetical protein